MSERVYGLAPFVPAQAEILILGSMPSVKSLVQEFYYAHPQNRMFKLIHHYLSLKRGEEIAPLNTVSQRQEALNELKIAMFDVVQSCVREGSLDSSISNVVYNDILGLVKANRTIKAVLTCGQFATKHFKRSTLSQLEGDMPFAHYALPSTSPAHTIAYEKLQAQYDVVLLPLLGLQAS